MFDIIYNLFFDFIGMLKWYIPMCIMMYYITYLIREGGR